MRALIVLAVAIIGIAFSAHQGSGVALTPTPVQQYNATCLDLSYTGCPLAR